MENDHLTKFHLTFSIDQKFLIIWAFDRILFGRLIESFNKNINILSLDQIILPVFS